MTSSSPTSLMNSQSIPYPDRFHLAASFVDKTYGDLETNTALTNDNKLILFALRQQAEVGPCNEPAPYMWNVTARYKHGAWKGLSNMSVPEAMVHYVRHIESMHPKWVQSVEYNKNNSNDDVVGNGKSSEREEGKVGERGNITTEEVANGSEESGENALLGSPSSKSDRDDASSSTTTTTTTTATSRRDKNKKSSNESKNETSKTKSRKSTINFNGNIVDFSLVSDSQLVSVVQSQTVEFESGNSEENNQFFVPNHVARGLVSEILRLRRSVLMMSAAARSDDNGIDYQYGQQRAAMRAAENETKSSATTAAVEHRYYSVSSDNNSNEEVEKPQQKEAIVVVEKTLDRDAQPVNSEEKDAQHQNVVEEQPQKSGWFSWLF